MAVGSREGGGRENQRSAIEEGEGGNDAACQTAGPQKADADAAGR